MRRIMDNLDNLLGTVIAIGLIVLFVTFVLHLDDTQRTRESIRVQREAAEQARVKYRMAANEYSCAPDGVAISSLDRLRDAVQTYDYLLVHGDIHNRKV